MSTVGDHGKIEMLLGCRRCVAECRSEDLLGHLGWHVSRRFPLVIQLDNVHSKGRTHRAEHTIIVTDHVRGLTHNSHSLKLDMV